MSDDRYTVGRAVPLDNPIHPSARLHEALQPKVASGGSGTKQGTWLAESEAKIRFYEALTELVRGVTPAAITLATILTEAAKKDSKP